VETATRTRGLHVSGWELCGFFQLAHTSSVKHCTPQTSSVMYCAPSNQFHYVLRPLIPVPLRTERPQTSSVMYCISSHQFRNALLPFIPVPLRTEPPKPVPLSAAPLKLVPLCAVSSHTSSLTYCSTLYQFRYARSPRNQFR
jgi:hypothetical protein